MNNIVSDSEYQLLYLEVFTHLRHLQVSYPVEVSRSMHRHTHTRARARAPVAAALLRAMNEAGLSVPVFREM